MCAKKTAKKANETEKKAADQSKKEEISRSQRELMVEAIREAMEGDFLEWVKGWASVSAPYNYTSGRRYQGGNRGFLTFVAKWRGYEDPRWITPGAAARMAAKRGETWDWQGQKCVFVETWKEKPVFKKGDDGKYELDDDGKKIIDGYYLKLVSVTPVLNMAQIKGAPAYVPDVAAPGGDFTVAEDFISKYYVSAAGDGAGARFDESVLNDEACYVPRWDKVKMPARTLFSSAEEFTAVLAHETVHSTGHPSRLNRDLKGRFGDADYAFEELIAEFGSAMLCADLGIQYNRDEASVKQHAAYLDSWRQHLSKDDGKAADKVASAIAMAGKAADFVLGYVRPELLAIHEAGAAEATDAEETSSDLAAA